MANPAESQSSLELRPNAHQSPDYSTGQARVAGRDVTSATVASPSQDGWTGQVLTEIYGPRSAAKQEAVPNTLASIGNFADLARGGIEQRKEAANSDEVPISFLTALARDSEPEVRTAVASNARTLPAVLMQLTGDNNLRVRLEAQRSRAARGLDRPDMDEITARVLRDADARAKVLEGAGGRFLSIGIVGSMVLDLARSVSGTVKQEPYALPEISVNQK